MSFASFSCGYLEAAFRTYVQDTILNLPNPYLRSTTVLLDKQHAFGGRYTTAGITWKCLLYALSTMPNGIVLSDINLTL